MGIHPAVAARIRAGDLLKEDLFCEPMSDCILALLQPLLRDRKVSEAQDYINLAVLAWNASLFGTSREEEVLVELLNRSDLGDEQEDDIIAIWNYVLEAKKDLFPEDRRFIRSYEVSWEGDSLKLEVTSIPGNTLPAPAETSDASEVEVA